MVALLWHNIHMKFKENHLRGYSSHTLDFIQISSWSLRLRFKVIINLHKINRFDAMTINVMVINNELYTDIVIPGANIGI